jgi:hypothetical protein
MDIRRTTVVTALNPTLGDWEISPSGNLVWTDDASGESTAQRLRIRFDFWRGEYFADTRQGVPYVPEILGNKEMDEATLSAIFRSVILSTPGIVSLISFALVSDGATREAALDFSAQLEDGKIFTSADYGPFLVRY